MPGRRSKAGSGARKPASRRVCLLTGAGGTLGSAFCRRFGAEYQVAGVYRHRKPAVLPPEARIVDPLRPGDAIAQGGGVYPIQADLRGDDDIRRVVEIVLGHFGRIDLLVNAAACSIWSPILASDALLDALPAMFRMNVEVPARLSAEVAKYFWRDREHDNRAWNRSVVNISSIAGVHVYEDAGQSGYSASKAALNILSVHMASEFSGFGVRVNALAPDSFPGALTPEGVCDWIVRLDQSAMTGRIVVMNESGDDII